MALKTTRADKEAFLKQLTELANKVELLAEHEVKMGRAEDRDRGLAREFKLEIAHRDA